MKLWPPTANLPVKVLLIDTHIGYSMTKLNFDFLMDGSYFRGHFDPPQIRWKSDQALKKLESDFVV